MIQFPKILACAITLGLSVTSAQAETLIEMKAYLKEELGASAKLSKESFNLSAEQQKELKNVSESGDTSLTFYYGKSAAGAMEKACSVLPQKGKEGPMTIGVCFDPAGLVKSVRVLSSEEERGKAVAERAFLKQFDGKKVADAFQVGKDIDGVSGATWSSKAVSESVRRASYGFKTFVRK